MEYGTPKRRGSGETTRVNRYVALEELDFLWDEPELLDFEFLWNEGHDVTSIAKYFKRDIDEILIIVIDRARRGRIEARKGGLLGCFTETEG